MTAPRCAGRRGRSRARPRRSAQASTDAAAHRSVCCYRPMPPAAPTKSDTRTSGSRGAPDSASRPRRRNPRTRALAETMCASRFRLTVASQRTVGSHAIAMAAPLDAAAEEARHKDHKGRHIAKGSKPEMRTGDTPTLVQLEPVVQRGLQREPAKERRGQHPGGRGQAAEENTEQRQGYRVGDG